jgi:NAD(P)-dependent dehydrogenase (short-subunit alcohol dehydrogenase family)
MRTVLITGASKGFGRELFQVFLERGWKVFPLVRDPAIADDLKVIAWTAGHPIVADVTSADVGNRIAKVLTSHTESLDLLINNAGSIRKLRRLHELAPEHLEELFRVHCVGALRCTLAALPFLRRAEWPIVANITSRKGSIGLTVAGEGGDVYSYKVAKCAQNMLTACLDHELRAEGIRVFAVHPGRLMTEVAPADADISPRDAAVRFADWACTVDRDAPCGIHDPVAGGLIAW